MDGERPSKKLKAGAAPDDGAGAGAAAPEPVKQQPSGSSMYVSRDERAKEEEDAGALTFRVIHNDGDKRHLKWLITLKNIFAQQLPKMPREYIVRLVLDPRHRSLVIIKGEKEMVAGGVCFRPFFTQRFAEIAFMAITSTEQVRGYGTRLMNHLKEAVKADDITHFLTYADNYAVGYFRKQGFSKNVAMPKSRWKGFIKDYDGGTLMECAIHKEVNYLQLPQLVKAQRAAIVSKHTSTSKANVVYPGLTFEEGAPPRSVYDIPGVGAWCVRASGFTLTYVLWVVEAGFRAGERTKAKSLRGMEVLRPQLTAIIMNMMAHSEAGPFLEPVDTTVYTDYLSIVSDPIDLSTMKTRLQAGFYASVDMFRADINRMFANARLFNAPDSAVVASANKLESFGITCIRKLGLQ